MGGVGGGQGGELAKGTPVEGLPEGCKGYATEGWNGSLSIAHCGQQAWQLLHLHGFSPKTCRSLHSAWPTCHACASPEQACQGARVQHFSVGIPVRPQERSAASGTALRPSRWGTIPACASSAEPGSLSQCSRARAVLLGCYTLNSGADDDSVAPCQIFCAGPHQHSCLI